MAVLPGATERTGDWEAELVFTEIQRMRSDLVDGSKDSGLWGGVGGRPSSIWWQQGRPLSVPQLHFLHDFKKNKKIKIKAV